MSSNLENQLASMTREQLVEMATRNEVRHAEAYSHADLVQILLAGYQADEEWAEVVDRCPYEA